MNYVIVSRHPAAIDFIRAADARFANAPVVAQATADDVRGRHIAGNLPLQLALLASSVTAVEFTGDPPRGAEYTIEEMRAAGARLTSYVVVDAAAPERVAALVSSESHCWAGWAAVRTLLGPERADADLIPVVPVVQSMTNDPEG
jgi:hypothetical protein